MSSVKENTDKSLANDFDLEKKYVNIDYEWSQIEYLRNNFVENSQVDVYLLKATVCLALVKKLDMSLLDMTICDSLKR